ncbi:MAG: ferritin family protein [Kiritimatiellae bacterium]|nr:ferritin family protein [Kiritimatiellia bacterium]
MDIFEFALKMERDGEAYYRELAEKSTDPGLASILKMLAEEEVRHAELIEALAGGSAAEAEAATVLTDAKNVFVKMKEEQREFSFHISQIDLYKKAQELEKKSQDFYAAKAEEAADGRQKKLFLQLAEQEKQHDFLLDNIIEFVSRPQTWLENAEWHHLDEY